MKKEVSNNQTVAFEIANRVLYSLKVLIIGLFIPFSFVFGITFKRHNAVAKSENINKPNSVTQNNNTIQFMQTGNDKNS